GAHVEPLLHVVHVDLVRVAASVGEVVGGQAAKVVHGLVAVDDLVGHDLSPGELHVRFRVAAKPEAVGTVGKQHFAPLNRHHGHGRVQPLQHGGEALVGGGEL